MADAAPLDPYADPPRRFVGNATTRLIHRTDSEDDACTADPDEHALVYSDSLAFLTKQEWDTRSGRKASFRVCPICEPAEVA